MDRLVNFLFSFNRLRTAIFAEVDWHNSITRTLNDPDSMKTVSAYWCEEDGWRGWTLKDNGNYFFYDIPEKSLSDIIDIVVDKEIVY
jgi:hypothetical protein